MNYEVAIVVQRDYVGLGLLAERMPVWACATAEHTRTAKACWRRKGSDQDQGITLFRVAKNVSPEQMLLGVLFNVDLHHGEHSHDPPWTVLRVVGANASPPVRQALATLGVCEFVDNAEGFTCVRELPP